MTKYYGWLLLLLLATVSASAQTPLEGTPITTPSDLEGDSGFVSRNESVVMLLNAIGAKLAQPVVISPKAQKKRVSGSFSLDDPSRLLERVAAEVALVWYSDGQSLYVYDATEVRNAVGSMRYAPVSALNEFLRKAGLAEPRHAVRGAGAGTFYVSGPPIYVDIVLNAARYIDDLYHGVDTSAEHVEVIKLENGFVNGRRYTRRGEVTQLGGMAEILSAMLAGRDVASVVRQPPVDTLQHLDRPVVSPVHGPGVGDAPVVQDSANPRPITAPGGTRAVMPVVIMAYPETNSILIRGTRGQIDMVKRLVAEIDIPRRQIELSLWIIDIKKNELDSLGVSWSGSVGIQDKFGVGFNTGGVSTLDGSRFLANISALSSRGKATVVSRPILLTQENVMANFDSNETFYVPLQGERVTSLESVTYGTSVSVVPRISSAADIEMQLQIEDGNSATGPADGFPLVARTTIDTVARVPHTKSLLVGGYTRSVNESGVNGIPGLKRIPWIGGVFRTRTRREENLVRVFLIEPRVLGHDASVQPHRLQQHFVPPAGGDLGELLQRLREPVGAPRAEAQHGQSH